MKFLFQLTFVLIISIPTIVFAQQSDTLRKKLDSLSYKTDSAGGQTNNTTPRAYNNSTRLNLNTYSILLGSDLKQSFTKPFHMSGKDWGNLGKFALVTGAVSFADEPIQKGVLQLRHNLPRLTNVSAFITKFGGLYEVYTLVSLGAYGFLGRDEKMQTAVLLATQAYLAASAVELVTKFVSGRTRPSYYPAGTEAEPRFLGPFAKTANNSLNQKINSSFPSGHTTVSFAAATVFAMEYRDKPIIPVIAYGAASIIGLSRISENQHWATDVLVGAALGILTGKEVVNNYHRFAKLKDPKSKKGSVTFSLNYSYGHVEPGLVYKFN